jgi:hypothetical protein
MERIAAIVEGHTEYHFIRNTYGASTIQRAITNGRDVEISVIVDLIADALDVLSGDIQKVVILLDREKRAISSEEFATRLATELAPRAIGRTLYFGVSDRMVENWIVADEDKMRSRFEAGYVYPGDGCHGKRELYRLNGGVSLGPLDTALLLKECSAVGAADRSPSLQIFRSGIDFSWAWAAK